MIKENFYFEMKKFEDEMSKDVEETGRKINQERRKKLLSKNYINSENYECA